MNSKHSLLPRVVVSSWLSGVLLITALASAQELDPEDEHGKIWSAKGERAGDPAPRPDRLPTGQTPLIEAAQLARLAGLDATNVQLLGESPVTLELSGTKLIRYKLFDLQKGQTYSVVVDPNGKLLDYDKLTASEQAARFERYGVMYPPLFDRINRMQSSQTLPVMIKLSVSEMFVDKSAGAQLNMARAGLAQQKRVTQLASDTFQKLAKSLDLSTLAGKYRVTGPFVVTELPAQDLLRLSKGEGVQFVGPYLDKVIEDTTTGFTYTDLDDALAVTNATTFHAAGFKGSGVRLAVMESGQANFPLSCFNVAARQTTSGGSNSHMTKSLAIWGNADSNYDGVCSGSRIGYVPDAQLLMANGSDYDSRYQWAKDNGADVISMSFHEGSEETNGALSPRDIYFDYWSVHYPWPSVFTSAGNQADAAYASGKGYNFLGVANMALDSSLSNRCDDQLFYQSSWKDPTSAHNDREVPAIAAPGERHNLLNTSFGGTSAATPVAASIAALLIDQVGSLATWPEAVRAILLASANYQNGDGALWRSYLDGRDGAGEINGYYAYWTAKKRETTTTPQYRGYDYGYISPSSFGSDKMFVKSWTAINNNAPIRVALTWNSNTSTSSSVLDADLDLWLVNASGSIVASSSSWDSSIEFLEYMPPAGSGNYTIKVRGYNVPSSLSSYFALAWTTHYDCD